MEADRTAPARLGPKASPRRQATAEPLLLARLLASECVSPSVLRQRHMEPWQRVRVHIYIRVRFHIIRNARI